MTSRYIKDNIPLKFIRTAVICVITLMKLTVRPSKLLFSKTQYFISLHRFLLQFYDTQLCPLFIYTGGSGQRDITENITTNVFQNKIIIMCYSVIIKKQLENDQTPLHKKSQILQPQQKVAPTIFMNSLVNQRFETFF